MPLTNSCNSIRKMDGNSIDDLKTALVVIAEIIVLHGEAYLPIFERIEAEAAAFEKRQSALARARTVLAEAKLAHDFGDAT